MSLPIGLDGNIEFSFDLPIADDATPEADETFTVTLSEQTTRTTITTATATTTIAVSDLSGTWAISQTSTDPVNEGDEASYTVQYTTTNAAEQGVTVSILVTVGFTTGQAQAEDFDPTLDSAALVSAISGRTPTAGPSGISARVVLAIAANGTAQAIIGLLIADDATQEGDETFTVSLSDQTTGTTIDTNTATTTIAANDSVPDGSWAIGTAAPTVNEGQNILYIVEYTGTPDEQGSTVSILVTVDLGTAQANDFNPTLTSESFATIIGELANPGDNGISATVELRIPARGIFSFLISLPINNDNNTESDEIFRVTLSEQTPGTTMIDGNADTVTTTIAANDPPSGMWNIMLTS